MRHVGERAGGGSVVGQVENQDDGPVIAAFMVVLSFDDDEWLPLVFGAEEQHVAFGWHAFDRRQSDGCVFGQQALDFFRGALGPFDVKFNLAHGEILGMQAG